MDTLAIAAMTTVQGNAPSGENMENQTSVNGTIKAIGMN
jgi:hypothetical protein